jgi:hypothetical protein
MLPSGGLPSILHPIFRRGAQLKKVFFHSRDVVSVLPKKCPDKSAQVDFHDSMEVPWLQSTATSLNRTAYQSSPSLWQSGYGLSWPQAVQL